MRTIIGIIFFVYNVIIILFYFYNLINLKINNFICIFKFYLSINLIDIDSCFIFQRKKLFYISFISIQHVISFLILYTFTHLFSKPKLQLFPKYGLY